MRRPIRPLPPCLAALLLLAVGAVSIAPAAPAQAPLDPAATTFVDLTHAFDEDTIYWPTDTQGFVLETVSEGVTEAGYYYAAHRFSGAEHGGTHLDAPIHFAAGRWTTEQIPVDRLIGPGIVVDVSERALADRDYRVTPADLRRWEETHGPIPDGAIVLLRTGYGRFWPDRAAYLGTARLGPEAIPELHFPGLHPEAARWLVKERSIHAIGLDTPSIDYGQSTLFESHRVLFDANLPAFENVANLDRLPADGFTVIALPMKIGGGSGGPLRIVAALPRRDGAPADAAAAALDAAYGRFSAAYRQGDPDGVAALYTDDAYYLSPGAEIARGDVGSHFAWLADFEPGAGPEISFEIVDRDVAGDLAYDVGVYTLRREDTPPGEESRGKFIVVWKRLADGTWKIHADGFSAIRSGETPAGD